MRISDWSSDVCSSDLLEWRLAPQGVEFGFVRAVKFADDLHALDERDVGLNEPIPLCLSRFGAVFEQRLATSLIAGVPIGFGHDGIDFEHSEDRTAIEQIFGSLHPSTARTNFEHSFAWIVRTWGRAEVNGVPCQVFRLDRKGI